MQSAYSKKWTKRSIPNPGCHGKQPTWNLDTGFEPEVPGAP